MEPGSRNIFALLPKRAAALIGAALLLVGVTAGIDRVVVRVVSDETVPIPLKDAIGIAHGSLVLVVIIVLLILGSVDISP